MKQTYPFSKRFITELLALIIKDKDNGRQLLSKLDPNLFSLKSDSLIFSILKQQKSFGGWNHLSALIELQFELGKIKSNIVEDALNTINESKQFKNPDLDTVRDIVKEAILKTSMGNALEQDISLYKNCEYDAIRDTINTSFEFARSLDLIIEEPMSMCLESYTNDILESKSLVERFPIGVYELDEKLIGGLGRGELGVVVAGRKGGKSILLCHIAQTAILLGKNVLYFTFELMKDVVRHRITSGLIDILINDILWGGKNASRLVKDKLYKLLKQTGGDFTVKFAPGKSMTIEDIGVYIANHEQITKRKVDVIIIDYADLIRPTEKLSDYDALDAIYLGIRNLGSPTKYPNVPSGFNAAVWTGSQLTRDSMNNLIIKESDIARCIGKTDHLDLLIAICRTEQEQMDRVARLYVPICRVVEGGENIGEIGPYPTDFEHGRIFDTNEVKRLDNKKCKEINQIDSLTNPFTTGLITT